MRDCVIVLRGGKPRGDEEERAQRFDRRTRATTEGLNTPLSSSTDRVPEPWVRPAYGRAPRECGGHPQARAFHVPPRSGCPRCCAPCDAESRCHALRKSASSSEDATASATTRWCAPLTGRAWGSTPVQPADYRH